MRRRISKDTTRGSTVTDTSRNGNSKRGGGTLFRGTSESRLLNESVSDFLLARCAYFNELERKSVAIRKKGKYTQPYTCLLSRVSPRIIYASNMSLVLDDWHQSRFLSPIVALFVGGTVRQPRVVVKRGYIETGCVCDVLAHATIYI